MELLINSIFLIVSSHSPQNFDGGAPIMIKEEPEDCGIRSIQKVPSLSDLSDPENSLGKCSYFLSNPFFRRDLELKIKK